jgi:hypothetical protein
VKVADSEPNMRAQEQRSSAPTCSTMEEVTRMLFWQYWVWTQGLMLARNAVLEPCPQSFFALAVFQIGSHIFSPRDSMSCDAFCVVRLLICATTTNFLLRWGLTNFCSAGLEPQSFQSLPSE